MSFEIGDKVIHWTFGLGEVVQIEEKVIREKSADYYVVRTPDLTIWIPIDNPNQHSLRIPTSPKEFDKLFAILSNLGEALPEDREMRKNQLMANLKDGQLASVCRVIRDLVWYRRTKKLNDQERNILERAKKSLLSEWEYSLGVSPIQAQQGMMKLLGE